MEFKVGDVVKMREDFRVNNEYALQQSFKDQCFVVELYCKYFQNVSRTPRVNFINHRGQWDSYHATTSVFELACDMSPYYMEYE